MTKWVIGGERFATKKEVEARIRRIKDEAPLGELQGADRIFATAFFALHPNVNKAVNIAAVHVARHPMGHRQFEVRLKNGRRLDISYQKPLRAMTGLDSHKADVLLAMRQAVHPQIVAFRAKASGSVVFSDDRVVDHAYPDTFAALVRRFMREHGVGYKDVKLVGGEGRLGNELSDEWRERWAAFHEEHAVLRLVDRGDNSRWGNRDPRTHEDAAS